MPVIIPTLPFWGLGERGELVGCRNCLRPGKSSGLTRIVAIRPPVWWNLSPATCCVYFARKFPVLT